MIWMNVLLLLLITMMSVKDNNNSFGVKDNKVKDGKCVNSGYKAQNLPVNQIDKRMTMFNLLIISILGLEYTNNANDSDEWVKYACRDIIQKVNSQKSNNFPDYPNLFLE